MSERVTLSGQPADPNYHGPAPQDIDSSGMHKDYWVLSEAERAKGFIRPVRKSYKHLVCGCVTTMNAAIAETYARNPLYYSSTFCSTCGTHKPVGPDGEFVWMENGRETEKVGT